MDWSEAVTKGDLADFLADEGRSFATLSVEKLATLQISLRPLPWIDGLTAMSVMDIVMSEDWMDVIWAEGKRQQLTDDDEGEILATVDDHRIWVMHTLMVRPERYRPYLAGIDDELEAAATWSEGFRFGMQLSPETSDALIVDERTRAMIGAIMCLQTREQLGEDVFAELPVSLVTPEEQPSFRRRALAELPDNIRMMHDWSLETQAAMMPDLDGHDLDRHLTDSLVTGPLHAKPKVGRNEPCPCGSGKKYKKCCIDKLPN